MLQQNLGRRIAHLRKARGLTQIALASPDPKRVWRGGGAVLAGAAEALFCPKLASATLSEKGVAVR